MVQQPPNSLPVEQSFLLGRFVKAHGLKGELIFVFGSDNPDKYQNLTLGWVKCPAGLEPVRIYSVNLQNFGQAILCLEGINSRTSAEEWVGKELYLPESELEVLSEYEFYYHELPGLKVEDAQYGSLGTVLNVLEMPAQAVLVVAYQHTEILVPITDEFVPRIDRTQGILYTSIPEGLLEAYTT
jgi:16S rRNA processing protein RimM